MPRRSRRISSARPTGRRSWACWAAPHLIVLAVGLVCFFPELVGLDEVTPFIQLTAARVPVLIVVMTILVAILVVRATLGRWRWAWSATVAVVTLAALAAVAPRGIPSALPTPATGGPTLRVLELNVDNGNAQVASLAALVRQVRPDVVVLPEAGHRFANALTAAVPEMGYQAHVGGPPDLLDGYTTTVLTTPALTGRPVEHEGVRFWWSGVDDTPAGVSVVGVHVSAPVPGQRGKWLADMSALNDLCRGGHPLLLVGDFNMTQDGAALRRGTGGCVDAASTRGQGLVGTWPSWLPAWLGMQIDHVFVAGRPSVQYARTVTVPDTDHRAVLVTVQMSAQRS